jgi:hypothetical protein
MGLYRPTARWLSKEQFMNPTYVMNVEPERCLLRITMSGFFAPGDVAALEIDRRAALARLGCPRNTHYTLVDVSACRLQPQDVVRAFEASLSDTRFMSRRIAFVTGSSLARMQVRRMIKRQDSDFFDTVEAAEAWLFELPPLRATG